MTWRTCGTRLEPPGRGTRTGEQSRHSLRDRKPLKTSRNPSPENEIELSGKSIDSGEFAACRHPLGTD